MRKDQQLSKKTIINLKRRATKFHTFSIYCGNCEKAVLQPKNEQTSAAATRLMDIADLEISSVLLCLNSFYYQANLKLIGADCNRWLRNYKIIRFTIFVKVRWQVGEKLWTFARMGQCSSPKLKNCKQEGKGVQMLVILR